MRTMRKRWAIWAVVLSLLAAGATQAFDTIRTKKVGLSGHVVGMTSVLVELQLPSTANAIKEVPVNEILTIYYEEDPEDVKIAKKHILDGRYEEAFTAISRVKKEPDRKEIRQDVEFYRALCAAKLALSGNGKIAEAGRMMKAFADANPNSYHNFEALEMVGDLLLAVQQYGPAADCYARLAKAPWPDYQMRAGVAAGRVLLAQGKTTEALDAFNKALASEASGDMVDAQRKLATLGKAGVALALKKPEEALQLADDVLRNTTPHDESLRAQAYNIMGTAHRQAERNEDALFAFLHVELLYPSVPSAHAEALANLAQLWDQMHKAERANAARKTLEERYKDSPWAKKAGPQP
jgi:tetratricopeptide (TPR) repeat protein